MDSNDAVNLYWGVGPAAKFELIRKIRSMSSITVEDKPSVHGNPSTIVTELDKHIGREIARLLGERSGLHVAQEEEPESHRYFELEDVVGLDGIDGTRPCREHVMDCWEGRHTLLDPSVSPRYGPSDHYSLISWIKVKGKPAFAYWYNFVTGEEVFIDAEGRLKSSELPQVIDSMVLGGYSSKPVHYWDVRNKDETNIRFNESDAIKTIEFQSLGIATLMALNKVHENAFILHGAQDIGLWDVGPALVASQSTENVTIVDTFGRRINMYEAIIPGGMALCRGEYFKPHLPGDSQFELGLTLT